MTGAPLPPDRRREIETLFEAALDVGPDERSDFLRQACGADQALLAEVSALLGAHEVPRGILESDPHEIVRPDLIAVRPGERIGPYAVIREIGRGGMAGVYLAQDDRHGRPLALKLLHPGLAVLLGHERFRREIRLAARLHHPHILPLHDSGDTDGRLWYTMPYVDGESLRERLRRQGRLSIPEAVRITREVADALDYAHRQGVIHRDIKPENLLLTRDGDVLVADFGIGRVFDASTPETTLTRSGVLIGTPAYVSPEQALGARPLDGRTDIYSLGCVLYEMLTGEPPYRAPSVQRVIAGHIKDPIPSARRVRPDTSAALDAALRRALAKSARDRFDTARRFADALEEPVQRSRRPLLAGGALAVLLLGGAWLVHSRRADPPPAAVPAEPGPSPGTDLSLAVLPLTNLGGAVDDEYLATGMADELTTALARVPGLRVAARTSALAMGGRRDLDAREMADRLNVGYLLEGTLRRLGDTVRVSMALVDAASGLTVWNQAYARPAEDVIWLQDEIARSVTGSLRESLPAPAPLTRPTVLRAHDDYLRGRHALSGSSEADLRRAISEFERAIAVDSGYAPAWSGLASAWTLLADDHLPPREAYPRAKAAALHALGLDSTLADAHAALGGVLFWYEWDFPAARRELELAIALDPNGSLAHYHYGNLLGAMGLLDSALAVAQRAALLDPLSGAIAANIAYLTEVQGRPQRAVTLCDPDRFVGSAREMVVLCRARALLSAGRPADALLLLDRHPGLRADLAERTRFGAYQTLGRTPEAREVLDRVQRDAGGRYVKPEIVAQMHAALGDRNAAFRWLDRAYEGRAGGLVFLPTSRWWDPIRRDPRFETMLKKVGGGA
jgi:serine/threonine-protein kinase